MKALRIGLLVLLSLLLSVPVFAKGSHGGRSSSPHSHSSHASKKSHNSGSHDGHYERGHGSSHKSGHYNNKKTGDHYPDRKHDTPQ
jgi:ABC-type nickel/cobalt efflux system permease component RcnA